MVCSAVSRRGAGCRLVALTVDCSSPGFLAAVGDALVPIPGCIPSRLQYVRLVRCMATAACIDRLAAGLMGNTGLRVLYLEGVIDPSTGLPSIQGGDEGTEDEGSDSRLHLAERALL